MAKKPKVGDPGQPCHRKESQGEGICDLEHRCVTADGKRDRSRIKTGRCNLMGETIDEVDNVCCEAKSIGKPDAAKAYCVSLQLPYFAPHTNTLRLSLVLVRVLCSLYFPTAPLPHCPTAPLNVLLLHMHTK